MTTSRFHTASSFEEFIALPENTDRLFELINGEIIEKVPGRTLYSQLALMIATAVRMFCLQHQLPCQISGADGAYRILGNVLAPDFAYKETPMSELYPDPEPPLWVVEVISPTDKAQAIRAKRRIYQAAGILLWEVYWEDQTVDVYRPGQPDRIEYGIDDTLNGDPVLPEFKLSVKAIFSVG
jgi:Uma2 family endonuclease